MDGNEGPVNVEYFDVVQGRARMKPRSAPGVDGVPPEVYRAIPEILLVHIWELFQGRATLDDAGESPHWKILEFFGIPKEKGARQFKHLRWLGKSPVLQKWFVRSLQPALTRQLRPTRVHAYGFKAGRKVTDITALVRQILHLSREWGLQVHMSFQDVRTAFDEMQHAEISKALLKRGASHAMTALLMQELSFMQAFLVLPGAGSTDLFPFTRGGKQGGVEPPGELNALIEATLDPVVASWAARGWGVVVAGAHHACYLG